MTNGTNSLAVCALLTAMLGCGVDAPPTGPDTPPPNPDSPTDQPRQGALSVAGAQAPRTAQTAQTAANPITASGEVCSCTKRYHLGPDVHTTTCDGAMDQCSSLEHVEECRGVSSPDCEYLIDCDCDCHDQPRQIFDHDAADGVFLTGIPELWQFNYGCDGYKGPFAVGCGSVALASMFYWWAQRGHTALIEDHMTGALQDWKSLVKELRDDYADGGLCINAQYATTQDRLLNALTSYPADHGIDAYASHYRVCGSCNADGLEDLTKSEGLDKIIEHLEAGRPLILGLNAGKMDNSSVFVDGESILTGDLSVGLGWIDHYAVITGYQRTSDGRDVIFLNGGWTGTDADLAVEWNPGGKWTHLFTLSIPDEPRGTPFCTLDAALSDVFWETTDVEVSHDTKFTPGTTREFTPMAGTACGVARDGEYEMFQGRWTENNDCLLHDPGFQPLDLDRGNDSGGGTIRDGYDDPLIRDELGPGPF
jgi:hypothetical protein